jgi:hypothetical protein
MLEMRYVKDDSVMKGLVACSSRPRDALDVFRFASGRDKSSLKLPVFFGSGRLSDGCHEPPVVFWCDTGGKPLECGRQRFRIYAKDVSGSLISKGYTPFSVVAGIGLINESSEIPGDPIKS